MTRKEKGHWEEPSDPMIWAPEGRLFVDRTARLIGLGTFLLGIALLLTVFYGAYQFFGSLEHSVGSALQERSGGQAVRQLVRDLIGISLAFVMAWVSSLIAGRGIHLYQASVRHK